MTENKTVRVTIEIPSRLYGAISMYFNEPHETMNDTILELIRTGINAASEKAWQATRRIKPTNEEPTNDKDSPERND